MKTFTVKIQNNSLNIQPFEKKNLKPFLNQTNVNNIFGTIKINKFNIGTKG